MANEMSDPFRVEGPAVISFSGGRTSGYMLRRILDAGLQPDVHVLFANTGKERGATLAFVHECETRWNVQVHWLEMYQHGEYGSACGVDEVDWNRASRDGEPFSALIGKRRCLPNPAMRFCTQELKIRPMKHWMRERGYEHWSNVVGIRADEPRRVAKMRANEQRERWENVLPLADAGVTLAEVESFWAAQPFDLQLKPHEGNCDLCFLKSYDKLKNIVRERPDLAQWWADQEARKGDHFRRDRPSYADMLAQGDLFLGFDDEQVECYCHD